MSVKICPICGGKVAISRMDCPHCLHNLKDDVMVTCPECNETVLPSHNECPVCGHRFVKEDFIIPEKTNTPKIDGKEANRKGDEAFDKKDYDKAFEWYKKGAEAGSEDAIFNLGWCYQYGKGTGVDFAQAFEWYKKGAEAGNAQAMAKLRWCYQDGIGTAIDSEKATYWKNKYSSRFKEKKN